MARNLNAHAEYGGNTYLTYTVISDHSYRAINLTYMLIFDQTFRVIYVYNLIYTSISDKTCRVISHTRVEKPQKPHARAEII